jgi:hypothetical protein
MLRECLRHDITPFIVQDKDKAEYISCLRNFHDKPEAFRAFAEKGQIEFESMVGQYLHE